MNKCSLCNLESQRLGISEFLGWMLNTTSKSLEESARDGSFPYIAVKEKDKLIHKTLESVIRKEETPFDNFLGFSDTDRNMTSYEKGQANTGEIEEVMANKMGLDYWQLVDLAISCVDRYGKDVNLYTAHKLVLNILRLQQPLN